MTKQILLPIQPQHAINILNGNATLLLKSWLSKDIDKIIAEHGGVWVNVVVTKGKPYLFTSYATNNDGYTYIESYQLTDLKYEPFILNGKVAFRFWFDGYEKLSGKEIYDFYDDYYFAKKNMQRFKELENKTQFNFVDKYKYELDKTLYFWHISKLEIFDTPKELSEFYTYKRKMVYSGMDCPPYVDEVKVQITKAPQRMAWVYGKE